VGLSESLSRDLIEQCTDLTPDWLTRGRNVQIVCAVPVREIDEIQLVKTPLKILAALVTVAILWLGSMYVLYLRDEAVRCDTITLTGWITSEMFVEVRDCLARSAAAEKTFVVKEAGGGDGLAALAFGILIHRHHWDVVVTDLCASSCANFIFPAGKRKYLNRDSMLLFHGGPYQANLLEMAEKFDQESTMNGAPVDSVILGQENKEGTIRFNPNPSKADHEVREFLSMTNVSTAVELVHKLRSASDQFYQELGVNPLISTYGQVGTYEPSYKSYKHGGFIYRLDSLRRLGVGNIELKEGKWHPERNPAYQEVYEVTYP
jgi:hypothetical protein